MGIEAIYYQLCVCFLDFAFFFSFICLYALWIFFCRIVHWKKTTINVHMGQFICCEHILHMTINSLRRFEIASEHKHTHSTVEMVHACSKGHGWKQTQHTIFYNCMKAARSYKFSINKNVLKEFYWQEIDINTLHIIFCTFLLIRCYNSWLKS